MWIGNTIFYNSDRDGKVQPLRLRSGFEENNPGNANRDWDVRWPSSDNQSKIIYERDGELEVMDVASKKANKLSILVPDDGINKRKRQASVANRISAAGIKSERRARRVQCPRRYFHCPGRKGRRPQPDQNARCA
jgi:tricorn protease